MVTYLHTFLQWCYLGQNCIIFGAKLTHNYSIKNDAGTASFVGAILDEFSSEHQHQSTQKESYSMPNLNFFCHI